MKKKILIIFFSIILINISIYLNFFYKNENRPIALGLNLNENIGELIEGNQIEQYFKLNKDYKLSGIEIMFSTFNRINNGKTKIDILDGEEVLEEIILNNSDILDNTKMPIYFNKDIDKFSKNLNIKITSNATNGNGITLWKDNTEKNNENILYINGERTKGQIVLDLLIKRKIDIVDLICINIFFIVINIGMIKFISFLIKTNVKNV